MVKLKERFVCQSCGAVHPRWMGHCEDCGEWNSILQEAPQNMPPKGLSPGKGAVVGFSSLNHSIDNAPRYLIGMPELDRVLGGGLVPGSAILIGGDPGIGKSTLLLQAVAALARGNTSCAYISGEEAAAQIAMRARRLGLENAPVQLASITSLRDIVSTLRGGAPKVAVIDSIQTIYADNIESAPGTVAQVRASAQELIRLAKATGTVMLLVGHVTKDGQIAGPRVLEHMVDTVLYFEGDRGHQFRILRAVKNRFGATDEIGVFAMTDKGLEEISNPSALFLGNRENPVSGAAVFAGMEGTRPLLVEIQALVAPTSLGTPRRAVVGWDSGRLAMIIAVLEARCGISFGMADVYLNVAGGLKISEPAADLAVAAALVSSLTDMPLPERTVVFGEISLAGEVRPVSQGEARLKEAAKLGFTHAIVPAGLTQKQAQIQLAEFDRLMQLLDLFPDAGRSRTRDR